MIFDCSDVKNVSEKYIRASSILSHSYSCEWNDEVHDSFQKYERQCGSYAQVLKNVANRADAVCRELNDLHIDQEKDAAEKLNRESEQLCQKARGLL